MKQLATLTFLLFVTQSFAMEFKPLKISVWRKGESAYGQELHAANETVADALSALPHPTEQFKIFKFECQAKYKEIQLSVYQSPSSSSASFWADLVTLYDLKDCNQISE